MSIGKYGRDVETNLVRKLQQDGQRVGSTLSSEGVAVTTGSSGTAIGLLDIPPRIVQIVTNEYDPLKADTEGKYTVKEINQDSVSQQKKDFWVRHINLDPSLAIGTKGIAIYGTAGRWGFFTEGALNRVYFDGCCMIDELNPAVASGLTWQMDNDEADGNEQQLLLHLPDGPHVGGLADIEVFTRQYIDCTFGGASGALFVRYRLSPIVQDFDFRDTGAVAPPRNTWGTKPTYGAGELNMDNIFASLPPIILRGAFGNGDNVKATVMTGPYPLSQWDDSAPIWAGLDLYGVAVQMAPQDAATPDVTGHAGGTFDIQLNAWEALWTHAGFIVPD